MKALLMFAALWMVAVPTPGLAATNLRRRPVVIISIDGLKPSYVLQADKHGLKIPNLRRFVIEGSYAEGVKGIVPTLTYPSHTTMVTGVGPLKHGIYTNVPFDPLEINFGGWHWYSSDIKATTLWDAATKAGLKTSNVDWPVTAGAKITFNIPQHWLAPSPTIHDRKLLGLISTPGLLDEIEKVHGAYPAGYLYTVEADGQRTQFSKYLIEKKKTQLHFVYLSSLDEEQHAKGPETPSVYDVLEKIDRMVGEILESSERAHGGKAIVAVVSDHGFVKRNKELRLNVALREAGLIELDDKKRVVSYEAITWTADGSAAVMLKEGANVQTVAKVRKVLQELAEQPANGIAKLYEGDAARTLAGFPGASFILGMKAGYVISKEMEGPLLKETPAGGDHGYLPETPEIDAAFFLRGPSIPKGKNLGRIDLRDIAPTLAHVLRLKLDAVEGRNVLSPGP